MNVKVYDEPHTFRVAVGDFFAADPIRHTVAVTVMHRALDDRSISPVMLTVHRDGQLYGAALRTPPWPLLISGLPADAASPAADALRPVDPGLPSVSGPRPRAEAFADAWTARTATTAREVIAGRLYRLDTLRPPTVPGRARRAGPADLPLLTRWSSAFQAEALGHVRHAIESAEHTHEHAAAIARSVELGDGMLVWEHGGQVVSWANVGLPVNGMSRVGQVYTPPELRGHGFGSAVTAAATRWARDAGADHVVLFTDLANPTSNAIYQKIGYRPVFDFVEIEFAAGNTTPS